MRPTVHHLNPARFCSSIDAGGHGRRGAVQVAELDHVLVPDIELTAGHPSVLRPVGSSSCYYPTVKDGIDISPRLF